MHIFAFTAASIAALGFAAGVSRTAWADPAPVISGPHVHENLAVYFVHGPSAAGPVPLTLQEALAKGSVRVIETGEVNELKVENTGEEDIFIQSGDIVKGGKQDRVLTMSFVLPPKSGERIRQRRRGHALPRSQTRHARPARCLGGGRNDG